DIVRLIGTTPITSIADAQYVLHNAPKQGDLAILWQRNAKEMNGNIKLADGCRKTDVSWRWSLKSLLPSPGIIGDDVTLVERKVLGLDARQFAYRHMNFLTPAARHAGRQATDLYVGLDEHG